MNKVKLNLFMIQNHVMTCFGIDVYEKDGQLYSEDEYEKL
jgi:hypothetical protein